MISKDYRQAARESLTGNWGLAIISLIIYGAIMGFSSNVPLAGSIFLGYPMLYGYTKFHMALSKGFGNTDQLFDGFRENYLDNAVTILISRLYLLLWTLLLFIPGIIKSYSYSMIPYILVDKDYNIFNNDAISKSRELMTGNKWKLFKLQLSFIGWHLLGLIFTLGILNLLYVAPYQTQATAHFYYDLKKTDTTDDRINHIVDKIIPQIEDEKDEWDF